MNKSQTGTFIEVLEIRPKFIKSYKRVQLKNSVFLLELE